MMAKKPKNADGAKELLEYLGTAKAENIYLETDPSDVAAHKQADTTSTTRCRRRPPSSSARPSRSPSSWTATPTRPSPPP